MFAVVKAGGQQYRVAKDDKIQIDNLNVEEGKKITLDNVIFIQNDNGEAVFGEPNVEGAVVEAEVIRNFKDKKVIIFKKRRRKNSRRKNGFRAQKTELKILSIKASGAKSTAKAAPANAETKEAPKKAAAKKTTAEK